MSINRLTDLLIYWVGLVWLVIATAPVQATPIIDHWVTTNGLRVYFVAAHELPIVDVRVVFAAGSSRDGEHPGLASFTNGLLDQGAGGLSADEIAEKAAQLGARLATEALRDMAIVQLRSLADPATLTPALDLARAVLVHPDFPDIAIERERARTLTALEEQQQSPASLAEQAFYLAIYGDHPYGHNLLGSGDTLTTITREDLLVFHQRYYTARNGIVAIVGDLDRPGAEALVQRLTADLPPGEAAPLLPSPAPLAQATRVDVSFPVAQTHLLIGQPALRRLDPDFYALYLGNHILGGGSLVSRIATQVREERGLSYSASSYVLPMAVEGPFTISLQTRNDRAGEASQVAQRTLEEFITAGPTSQELEEAKQHLTGGFALRIDSNRKIVEYLAVIGFYQLPLDYLDSFREQINALTQEQVRDACQRHIHPDRLVTVAVGGGH